MNANCRHDLCSIRPIAGRRYAVKCSCYAPAFEVESLREAHEVHTEHALAVLGARGRNAKLPALACPSETL